MDFLAAFSLPSGPTSLIGVVVLVLIVFLVLKALLSLAKALAFLAVGLVAVALFAPHLIGDKRAAQVRSAVTQVTKQVTNLEGFHGCAAQIASGKIANADECDKLRASASAKKKPAEQSYRGVAAGAAAAELLTGSR